MMFNPDDENLFPTRKLSIQIFKLFTAANGDGEDGEQDLNREAYKVEVTLLRLFHLVVSLFLRRFIPKGEKGSDHHEHCFPSALNWRV